jgi:hypothetical protein
MPRDLRLTIGIPTQGKRPDLLQKAIGSALAQSVPCRVLICAQGDPDVFARMLAPYREHPLLRVVPSPARSLWANWRFAVESCDTEVFAWLQDDDRLAPHMARRALESLDRSPAAVAWIARLGISTVPGLANWWQATGPMVPMDLIHGGTTEVHGGLLAAAGYFSSFALSPAVAFRCTPAAIAAVRRCPEQGCDLFNERTVLAEIGRLGPIVCDPVIAGEWVMHDDNTSRKQVTAGEGDAQYRILAAHLDAILAELPAWPDVLRGWAALIGLENVGRFLAETVRFAGLTPSLDAARDVLSELTPAQPREPDRAGRKPRRQP